jgi:hypothetical protein
MEVLKRTIEQIRFKKNRKGPDVKQIDYISNLSRDSLTIIFSFVSFRDLMSLSVVNKLFHSVTQSDFLWQHLLLNTKGTI